MPYIICSWFEFYYDLVPVVFSKILQGNFAGPGLNRAFMSAKYGHINLPKLRTSLQQNKEQMNPLKWNDHLLFILTHMQIVSNVHPMFINQFRRIEGNHVDEAVHVAPYAHLSGLPANYRAWIGNGFFIGPGTAC